VVKEVLVDRPVEYYFDKVTQVPVEYYKENVIEKPVQIHVDKPVERLIYIERPVPYPVKAPPVVHTLELTRYISNTAPRVNYIAQEPIITETVNTVVGAPIEGPTTSRVVEAPPVGINFAQSVTAPAITTGVIQSAPLVSSQVIQQTPMVTSQLIQQAPVVTSQVYQTPAYVTNQVVQQAAPVVTTQTFSTGMMPTQTFATGMMPAQTFSTGMMPAQTFATDVMHTQTFATDVIPQANYSAGILANAATVQAVNDFGASAMSAPMPAPMSSVTAAASPMGISAGPTGLAPMGLAPMGGAGRLQFRLYNKDGYSKNNPYKLYFYVNDTFKSNKDNWRQLYDSQTFPITGAVTNFGVFDIPTNFYNQAANPNYGYRAIIVDTVGGATVHRFEGPLSKFIKPNLHEFTIWEGFSRKHFGFETTPSY